MVRLALGTPAGLVIHQKKPSFFRAVAHQHVFSLLIGIKHHLVSLPADARLLAAAKGRVVAREAANGYAWAVGLRLCADPAEPKSQGFFYILIEINAKA